MERNDSKDSKNTAKKAKQIRKPRKQWAIKQIKETAIKQIKITGKNPAEKIRKMNYRPMLATQIRRRTIKKKYND